MHRIPKGIIPPPRRGPRPARKAGTHAQGTNRQRDRAGRERAARKDQDA